MIKAIVFGECYRFFGVTIYKKYVIIIYVEITNCLNELFLYYLI